MSDRIFEFSGFYEKQTVEIKVLSFYSGTDSGSHGKSIHISVKCLSYHIGFNLGERTAKNFARSILQLLGE